MSITHKAYAFDWSAFERDELHGILLAALSCRDTAALCAYVNSNLEAIKDPYEGEPLGEDWQELLENRDVQEYGDFALTRFYDPAEDRGLGDSWRAIDLEFAEIDRAAFLGMPFGPVGAHFDPGRLGSYFQTPTQVLASRTQMRQCKLPGLKGRSRKSLEQFNEFLVECVEAGSGLYVTF